MGYLDLTKITKYTNDFKAWIAKKYVAKQEGKGLSTHDYTTTEREKLGGIAEGAEANVQADWNESDPQSDAYVKNKPSSLPANGGNANTVGGHTVEKNVPENAIFADMKGASDSAAGEAGYVPAPARGQQGTFLRGDGTWATPADTKYDKATAAKDGLMSKEDFAKLAEFGKAGEYSKTKEVEALITGKGYQTADQVNATITGKGYQTAAQVQQAVAAAGHIKKEIVAILPEASVAEENVIYMVPNNSGEDGNVYNEYLKIDGKLELIGSTKVDLSNYLQKDDLITDQEIEALFAD